MLRDSLGRRPDQAEQTVRLVVWPSGEGHIRARPGNQSPKSVDRQRCTVASFQRVQKRARGRLVYIDLPIAKVADQQGFRIGGERPKFGGSYGHAPWCVQLALANQALDQMSLSVEHDDE